MWAIMLVDANHHCVGNSKCRRSMWFPGTHILLNTALTVVCGSDSDRLISVWDLLQCPLGILCVLAPPLTVNDCDQTIKPMFFANRQQNLRRRRIIIIKVHMLYQDYTLFLL